MNEDKTLYDILVEAGQGDLITSHESDMYIPATENIDPIIFKWMEDNAGSAPANNAKKFFSDTFQEWMWEFPFQYTPFWTKRGM